MNKPRVHVRTQSKLIGLGLICSRNAPAVSPSRHLISQPHHQFAPLVSRRRGGSNLNERFAHLPNHLSHTGASFVDANVSQLSAPGAAHQGSQEAAFRLARESEEYILVDGVRIPKKPRPPADDGSSLHISRVLLPT
jgi:hypothetical protein